MSNNHKSLTVCIIGKPNAGKSTLLNRLIGQKISIVTPKVQTTRSIITGIVTIDDTQIILFDTPGIFEPRKKLEKAMVRCAWSSLSSAEIIVLIIDATTPLDEMMEQIIERLNSTGKKIVFLLNKIDLNAKFLASIVIRLEKTCPTASLFNISALTGRNINDFINFLKNNAKDENWLYEKDDMTTMPMRFLAAEITREQLFMSLHQELPYNLTVESESWQQQADGSIKINQIIIVSRESYKIMVIGKGGRNLKAIGTKARKEIEQLTGCKVHLFLFVKVRQNWDDNPELYNHV